jgi:hypothetical protein
VWKVSDLGAIRARFLQDDLPVRLGGIAANLARISSFARNRANKETVHSLLDESKHLIEWTAGEAGLEIAAELVELQVRLACWQRDWDTIWNEEAKRAEVARQCHLWSERILQASGLLNMQS